MTGFISWIRGRFDPVYRAQARADANRLALRREARRVEEAFDGSWSWQRHTPLPTKQEEERIRQSQQRLARAYDAIHTNDPIAIAQSLVELREIG